MRKISAIACSVLTLTLYATFLSAVRTATAQAIRAESDSSAQPTTSPSPQGETPPSPQVETQPTVAAPSKTEFAVSPPLAERTVVVEVGKARQLKLSRPFKAVYVTDNDIVDVLTRTDQDVVLLPKKEGTTNVYFVGLKNEVILNVDVSVDKYVAVNEQARALVTNDPELFPYKHVEVHNKAKLDSHTSFRCGPNGCFYVGETTVEEPAPLPAGNTASVNKNFNTNDNIYHSH